MSLALSRLNHRSFPHLDKAKIDKWLSYVRIRCFRPSVAKLQRKTSAHKARIRPIEAIVSNREISKE
jgi:hypothetical protein